VHHGAAYCGCGHYRHLWRRLLDRAIPIGKRGTKLDAAIGLLIFSSMIGTLISAA